MSTPHAFSSVSCFCLRLTIFNRLNFMDYYVNGLIVFVNGRLPLWVGTRYRWWFSFILFVSLLRLRLTFRWFFSLFRTEGFYLNRIEVKWNLCDCLFTDVLCERDDASIHFLHYRVLIYGNHTCLANLLDKLIKLTLTTTIWFWFILPIERRMQSYSS
jgi:hypothetical protein